MSYSTPEPSLVWADHCEGEIFGLEFSGLELWGSGHQRVEGPDSDGGLQGEQPVVEVHARQQVSEGRDSVNRFHEGFRGQWSMFEHVGIRRVVGEAGCQLFSLGHS